MKGRARSSKKGGLSNFEKPSHRKKTGPDPWAKRQSLFELSKKRGGVAIEKKLFFPIKGGN